MDNLYKEIMSLYEISEIRTTEKIEKGFLSENYKLDTDKGLFFLKKYRFSNILRIKEIHAGKDFFNKGGVPVIMPTKTVGGGTFFEKDGSYFALFPFVRGVQPERGELSSEMIISLGKMLAKIHLVGKDSRLEVSDQFKAWDKEKSLEKIAQLEDQLDEISEKSDFDLLAKENLNLKKKLIQKNVIQFEDLGLRNDHLVHGDYLDQNVFFNKNGDVAYIFDFEKIGYEPRSQELFRSASFSFLDTKFDDTSIENIRLYIKSYQEVYPFNEKELREGLLAFYLKSSHGLWVETEHYVKGNYRVDLFLEREYKRLKFMTERMSDLREVF